MYKKHYLCEFHHISFQKDACFEERELKEYDKKSICKDCYEFEVLTCGSTAGVWEELEKWKPSEGNKLLY